MLSKSTVAKLGSWEHAEHEETTLLDNFLGTLVKTGFIT